MCPLTSTSNRTMTQIPNWSLESRTPTLTFRITETNARAALHRTPDTFPLKWRAKILVEDYPVWTRGFETKESAAFGDVLRKRPAPELGCPACVNEDVIVG